MGEIDRKMKEYFSDRRRYADLWNGSVFEGRQLVRGEELEGDATVATYSGQGESAESIPDVVMKQVLGKHTLAVWILQDQTIIDYSMPVRVMLDEAMRYHGQVKDIRRKNRGTEAPDPGEYLYHFRAEDRLVPVATLVVYWGRKPWDGPRTLHGMMDFSMASRGQGSRYGELEERLRELVPDYPVHILDLSAVEDYSSFRTELRLLFELYACRDSREKLQNYLDSHKECSRVDWETCQMLGVMMNIRELERIRNNNDNNKEAEEGVDMCQALKELIEEGKLEGMEAGRLEGMEAGRLEGMEAGRLEGMEAGRLEGEEQMARLTQTLLAQDKMDELKKALADTGYRRALFAEYGMV